ncbi:MAG: hypothetical protein ACI4CS_09790 [Candidatus Weimeria sp.]
MFGKKKETVDDVYLNAAGVQFADPVTRTITGDFSDVQKAVLLEGLQQGYPVGAVADPEIDPDFMEPAMYAWEDIYEKGMASVPLAIQKSDIYEVALAFTKAKQKYAPLILNHNDTTELSGAGDNERHTWYEDIENTMMHLYILDGYGKNLMELSPDPLSITKRDIIYLAAGIQAGFDDTKEYLKKGTINRKKILKLCEKNGIRMPFVKDGLADVVDNKVYTRQLLMQLNGY